MVQPFRLACRQCRRCKATVQCGTGMHGQLPTCFSPCPPTPWQVNSTIAELEGLRRQCEADEAAQVRSGGNSCAAQQVAQFGNRGVYVFLGVYVFPSCIAFSPLVSGGVGKSGSHRAWPGSQAEVRREGGVCLLLLVLRGGWGGRAVRRLQVSTGAAAAASSSSSAASDMAAKAQPEGSWQRSGGKLQRDSAAQRRQRQPTLDLLPFRRLISSPTNRASS